MIVSKSFTAVGTSNQISVKYGESIDYSLSGTFSASVVLQRSRNGGISWDPVTAVLTSATSGSIQNQSPSRKAELYRIACVAFVSGTAVTSISDAVPFASKKRLLTTGAKVGGTAGFVVAAAANTFLITCPASQTGSKLIVPVSGLNVGDVIYGFHLVGQIESAGGTVTVDAELRKQTAAAADVVDASVASITQLSVTADAIMSSANTQKAGLNVTVAEDETYYLIVTATTAASTDIALQGVALLVVPA
jgi:hypothetical protein